MAYFECTIGGGDGSTLTVTCYSGFAGLTISITNGVDTFSDVCPNTSPYEVVFEGLANGTWTLSTVYNGVTYTDTVEVNLTTQFYPIPNGSTVTPVNVIQTWLHCANIWNKTYTTINQVLADTSTLLALISSNNAADYMARSTNWASSVCANQTAMGYIGNNNYCANKLLANSTWRNAICNSAYMESVLNVKVPTMTSNTTPSGIAFATNQANNNAYRAFNGNINVVDDYYFATTKGSGANSVGYQFPSQIIPRLAKVKFYVPAYISSINYKIEGSNDGSSYTALSANQTTTAEQTIVLNNSNSAKYRYLRMNITAQQMIGGNYNLGNVDLLQFYGRA